MTTLPGPFGGGPAGIDLMQAFLSVYYSGKTSDRFTWGIGPVFAVQAFSADGVVMFSGLTKTFAEPLLSGGAPGNPTSLTNNGHDYSTGYGFGAGVWFAMNDAVSLGPRDLLRNSSKQSLKSRNAIQAGAVAEFLNNFPWLSVSRLTRTLFGACLPSIFALIPAPMALPGSRRPAIPKTACGALIYFVASR